jgi:hypothetical protein
MGELHWITGTSGLIFTALMQPMKVHLRTFVSILSPRPAPILALSFLIVPDELHTHPVIRTGSRRHFAGVGLHAMQHGAKLRQRNR